LVSLGSGCIRPCYLKKIISSEEYWTASIYAPAIELCCVIYGLDQHLAFGIHVEKRRSIYHTSISQLRF
jgi:hypothetical protein